MPKPDLSEFEQLSQRSERVVCKTAAALAALDTVDPQEASQLVAALASANITPSAIQTWCERRGLTVTKTSVVNHRNGRCRCHG